MKCFILKFSLFASIVLIFSGCTITRNVSPVSSGTSIQTIYVQRNPKVLMDGFHPELVKQIQELGFEVESYEGSTPAAARYYLTYTANWQWDVAMYLTYFDATLFEDGKSIGNVEYDARRGSGRMDKFGHTAEKIRPLLIDLFKNVDRKQPVTGKSSSDSAK
ncbi:MAG TPA: Sbal_3080 family lipoprotein [Verrucomicrobiae bacterium]|nr:Sbal_3080 family lipoprotein [Verrucomicrobiae bacterium]